MAQPFNLPPVIHGSVTYLPSSLLFLCYLFSLVFVFIHLSYSVFQKKKKSICHIPFLFPFPYVYCFFLFPNSFISKSILFFNNYGFTYSSSVFYHFLFVNSFLSSFSYKNTLNYIILLVSFYSKYSFHKTYLCNSINTKIYLFIYLQLFLCIHSIYFLDPPLINSLCK